MTYLSEELYRTITDNIPIVCIDIVPVKKVDSSWQIGVATLSTGPEAGKLAIFGGRVQHNETILDAIKRHLSQDLDINNFSFYGINNVARPFHVQEYLHQKTAEPPHCYDPTKHAVSLIYLINLDDEPKPKNEVSDFRWISRDQVPAISAYNQLVVMNLAFEALNQG